MLSYYIRNHHQQKYNKIRDYISPLNEFILRMKLAIAVFDMSNVHPLGCQNTYHNTQNTEIHNNENDCG